MVTDLVEIRRLGEKMRGENERFRRFMKSHETHDRRLRILAQEVEDQIDCRACANCCRVATVELQERDVERIAKALRIKPGKFLRDYTVEDEEEGVILKRDENGCVFLSGNDCTIYEDRPATCINFPHLVRGAGSLDSRMWQFIDRACYCPIVFNALEVFKRYLKFSR